MDRENKGKRGKYEVLERQEKTMFKQLIDLYRKEGDGRNYILEPSETYLNYFEDQAFKYYQKRPLWISGSC